MKRFINSALRKRLGLEIRKTSHNPKEDPIPLVSAHARRLIYFYDLLCKVANVEGDIVECGVGWGRSLFAFALLSELFDRERKIYGFDSFQGFPEPTREDEAQRHNIKKGRYSTTKEGVIRYLVNSGMNRTFIDGKIILIEGYFSQTLREYSGRAIALLHLDCDLYQSYKESLHSLYPKMARGGVIAFDDYHEKDKFPGAKKAIDEFFTGREEISRSNMINRYYAIKE
jgi:hypothetical protein